MIEHAVVLAAGEGNRLRGLTNGRPKSLFPVAGKPLIDHVLTSLAQAGISEVVIVLGYQGEEIEGHVGDGRRFALRVRYVWNPYYRLGNASSFWSALPLVVGSPFLLAMADHLCHPDLLRALLAYVPDRIAIAIDRSTLDPERTDDATKVELRAGSVAGIGKRLVRWDGIDTGFSLWPAHVAAGIGIDQSMCGGELAALMASLASASGGLAACDVTGHFWFDVDTEDDIQMAERMMAFEADEFAPALS
ncbi:MAG: NTP transferase domain-containing protein [Chloroflexi bacterium]|nr:NTP transferase domain-containing protein [Chloroflexota bacterium]